LSLLQDLDRIVLDEAVLGVARMFREELVVMPHDEDVLVVEEARVPGQPPTIGKQVVNFIIRIYGIKYKIFHEQVLIKSSRNETLVLSLYYRTLIGLSLTRQSWGLLECFERNL
jgi:hypothetical protein